MNKLNSEGKIKSNRDLARAYTAVMTRVYWDGIGHYIFATEKLIADYPINLIRNFSENGNLDKLPQAKIGKKSKEVLELIMECGTEETIKTLSILRDKKNQRDYGIELKEQKLIRNMIERNSDDLPDWHRKLQTIVGY